MKDRTVESKPWEEQIADAAARFPVAMLLTLLNTFFVWLAVDGGSESRFLILAASGLAIPLSIASRLIVEKITRKRGVAHFLQVLSFGAFIALSVWFDGIVPREHFAWTYMLSLGAAWALAAWAQGLKRGKEALASSLAFGGFIGGMAAFGVGCGASLILGTLNMLFDAGFTEAFAVAWGSAVFTVGLGFAIAYALKEEPFVAPKAWKVLVGFIAFPVSLVFLAVLLAYALKCAVTASLPNGEINWLVGSATLLWLLMHPLLAVFEGRIFTVFRRVGPWCMAPLIALQAVAVAIRINAYGLTPMRYASVLLVVFAALYVIATAIRPTFADRSGLLFVAAMALFAGLSPWNVVDFGVEGQVKRLASFAERRDKGEKFDEAARFAIMDSWDFVKGYERVGNHWDTRRMAGFREGMESRDAEFEKEWGFKHLDRYGRSGGWHERHWGLYSALPNPIAIAGFSTMEKVSFRSENGKVFARSGRSGALAIDITDHVKAKMKETGDPKEFSIDLPGGGRIVVENINVYFKEDGEGVRIASAWGEGFAFGREGAL